MKSLFISTLVVIVLITSWIIIYNFIDESVTDINSSLTIMEAKVHDSNWDSTSSIYKTIDKKWEETKKVLMLILDHEEMEKINLTLRKIEKFISIEDKSLTLGEIATLKYLFSHVEEKESLSLKNIF